MLSKQTRLDQIAAEIINNNICPDLAQTATQLVMGSGSPDAHIVIIGEAPGRHEDETGEAFVGASGTYLDELLSSIEMSRSHVYVTNIVKYRPPNNRDPKSAEKQAFLPYLLEQLEVVQPKLVITLGKHSLQSLLPELEIGAVHGQKQVFEGYTVLPLYHPAAGIYNRKLRPTMLQDFKQIPILINEL